jgi:hypothetical protein
VGQEVRGKKCFSPHYPRLCGNLGYNSQKLVFGASWPRENTPQFLFLKPNPLVDAMIAQNTPKKYFSLAFLEYLTHQKRDASLLWSLRTTSRPMAATKPNKLPNYFVKSTAYRQNLVEKTRNSVSVAQG